MAMNAQSQLHDMNEEAQALKAPSSGLSFLSGAYANQPGSMLTPSQLFLGQQQFPQGVLPQGLSFTTEADARKAVMELIRHNTNRGILGEPHLQGGAFQSAASKKELLMKRACRGGDDDDAGRTPKKPRVDSSSASEPTSKKKVDYDPNVKIPPSEEGLSFYEENDVLCGRGGGTNVHPGNKLFRDLINSHRREYLRAKKNDKPDISRSIVRIVRETGGRFLKRDEKAGLWYEIGDDSAREKTSQALRQRAPEMRRLLFRDEYNQEEIDYRDGFVPMIYHPNPAENAYLRSLSEGLFQGKNKEKGLEQEMPMPSSLSSLDAYKNDLLLKSRYGGAGIGPVPSSLYLDPQVMYLERGAQQWRTEALLGGGINRFTPHGA